MYYKEVIYMPHVSLRVTEQEKSWMESYAKVHNINLSDAVKEAFFEKLEDEYDLHSIKAYEKENVKGNMVFRSHEDVGKMLGLK